MTPAQLLFTLETLEIIEAGDQAKAIHAAAMGSRADSQTIQEQMTKLGA